MISVENVNLNCTNGRMVLTNLEYTIMRQIWSGYYKTASIHYMVNKSYHKKLAITTVQTTLDRLAHKGFIKRKKDSKALMHYPTYTEENITKYVLIKMMNVLHKSEFKPDYDVELFLESMNNVEEELQEMEVSV